MAEQTMLKPCPFCGHEGKALIWEAHNGDKYAGVQCTNCEAEVSHAVEWWVDEGGSRGALIAAVTSWNTRANSALMDDLRELLSDLSTYFDSKSDLQDGDYGTQEPNAELHHHAAIEALLKRIGG